MGNYEINVMSTNIVYFVGHGNFPYLCGNINDVIVSPLLYTCYRNSQSLSRAYEQYGASTIQPISEEMQLLLTVYYLVQLGKIILHPERLQRINYMLANEKGSIRAGQY